MITRTFDSPRELVFKAWTDPKHVTQWWGPHGFTNPVCELDVRPGGAIRIHMRGPDGTVYPMTGTFHEVVEPERLVFAIRDRPTDRYELVTVLLTDLGDGRTEMHFEQRGDHTPEQYEHTKEGWAGFFARIDERLFAAR